MPFAVVWIQNHYWKLPEGYSFGLFFPLIIFAAWLGGSGLGVIVTVISTVLLYFNVIPLDAVKGVLEFHHNLGLGIFVLCGIGLNVMVGLYRQGQQVLRETLDQMRAKDHELVKVNDQLQNFFENANEGILSGTLEGDYLFTNQMFCRMTGYSKEEVLKLNIRDIIPLEDREKLETARQSVDHCGDHCGNHCADHCGDHSELVRISEWNLKCKNGDILPIEVSSRVFANGTWQAFVRDISERKKDQLRLNSLSDLSKALVEPLTIEERLQVAADAMVPNFADIGILSLLEHDKLYFKGIRCLDPEVEKQIKDLKCHIYVPESQDLSVYGVLNTLKPIFVGNVEESVDQGNFLNMEPLRKRLKSLGIKSYLVLPLVARGRAIGTLFLAMNSVHRHFAKSDCAFFQDIANRCAVAAENSKLYSDALKAVKARELILSIVSHDLRNPLSVIEMSAGLLGLDRKYSVEELQKIGQRIGHASSAMERMISDLLDFSKIQARKLSIEKWSLNVESLVSASLEAMAVVLKGKNQRVETEIEPGLPRIWGDQVRLIQVLWNLLGNASKFAPKNSVLQIQVRRFREAVLFAVIDSGPGMSEQEIPKVFDLFWQSDRTAHLGTGLGLAITKGIIDAHAGKIWVESKIGMGCKFYFTVPVAEDTSNQEVESLAATATTLATDSASERAEDGIPVVRSSTCQDLATAAPKIADVRGLNIHLVDDSADSLYIIKFYLEKNGAFVCVSQTISEALSKVEKQRPDVLITDIEMPEGDGYQLMSKLGALWAKENIEFPVIAMTGYTEPSVLSKINNAGFDGYLSKPVSLDKLLTAIENLRTGKPKKITEANVHSALLEK